MGLEADRVTLVSDYELNRGSLIFSAIFHLVVIVLVFIGVPQLFKPKPLEDTPIAVQLVTLAPETRATQVTKEPPKPDAKPEPQIAQAAPEPPKPEPPKVEPPRPAPPPPPPPPPAPEAKPEPPKPEPPKPAPPPPPPPPLPEPKPEPKPPEPKPEPPKPEPPKPEPPKAEPKPEPPKQKIVEAPKPRAKPEPPKPDQKQLASDFDALLKNLTRQKTAPTPEDAQPKAKQPPAQQQASSQPVAPLGSQLTVSEKDLVIHQIEQCWNFDPGTKGAKDLLIDVHIDINPDRTVNNIRIVDTARMASDPFFRAAAESVIRAIKNPQCSPLKLPPDKYETWKSTDITFNPRDML
jgi:hypothetical protein